MSKGPPTELAALDRADETAHPLRLPPGKTLPVLAVGALYLLATGRWGSYVAVPGLPIYISDVVVAAAVLQTVRAARREGTGAADLRKVMTQGPLLLLLTLSLLVWAGVRFLLGIVAVLEQPLVALRDVVPYAYAVAALLAFLVPIKGGSLARRLVYTALTFHAGWLLLANHLPGWPWARPLLGGAPIFTPRSDFDSAVLGVAVALALYDLLVSGRPRRPLSSVLLLGFVAANLYAITTLPTRAGFMAGVLAGLVVVCIWGARVGSGSAGRGLHLRRLVVLVAAGAVVTTGVLFTPPGHRLVDGIRGLQGEQTQASGTIEVRQFVWGSVWDYVTADATRTAVGVGFGPDFIQSSGSSYALEGTEYKDVRSPHNYLLGTFARLGLGGALLAALVIVAGFVAAVRELARRPSTVTALACMVLVALPVTAMLGVILESPFGALPYFWAIGQVTRSAWRVAPVMPMQDRST